jgi:hypothetical protein
MPRRDDDEFALAAERDRVAAGLEDYAPDDVPPAADPPPPGVSEAVDLAERGLLDDTSIDTSDRWQRSAAVWTFVMDAYTSGSWAAAAAEPRFGVAVERVSAERIVVTFAIGTARG